MLRMARTGYIPKRCCSQCHFNNVVQVWHITNSRQPKQIGRQTIVCLPNATVNSGTCASIIELGVTYSECLLSRWKTNCRIQERNCSIIQQGQIYFPIPRQCLHFFFSDTSKYRYFVNKNSIWGCTYLCNHYCSLTYRMLTPA